MRIYRHVTANDVRLEPFPFKRELSMEAYLIENESVLSLDDVFSNVEIIDTEITLKQGRPSNDTDGRIDILAVYSQEYIAVVELKLGQLEEVHLKQMEDYLCKRNQIFTKYPDILTRDSSPNPKWIGVLVGSTINSSLADKLRRGYVTTEDVPVAAITIQRFRGSDGTVLVTTDTYFSRPPAGRDTSQYLFDGQILGKGRLVLAIVKRHVEEHPTITYAELAQAFPKSVQGSSGVVATANEANKVYSDTSRKRHFLNAEDLVQLQDSVVAVSTQWGIGNINRFLLRAKELGYSVEPTVV